MILEIATLQVRPEEQAAFESAFPAAARILSSVEGYISHELQRSVDTLSERQHAEEQAVAAAGSVHAARANPEELQAQIKDLTADIALRRKALERLKQGAEGRRTGFAPALEGLARRHVDGLWLSHLVLSGSVGMTLEGTTLDADLVPRYLHGLSADPALVNRHFPELDFGMSGGRRLALQGGTLLHVAAEYGNLAAAALLLDRGADVNARATVDEAGIGGQTATFHAVTQFDDDGLPVTQLLVERGADLTVRAKLPGDYERPGEIVECTALGYALLFGGESQRRTVTLLRERGAVE